MKKRLASLRADLGALVIVGAMRADGGRALDDLADSSRELARGDLAPLPEPDLLAAQDRDDDALDRHDASRRDAEPHALHQDVDESGQRLGAEEGRLHEGIADEHADRLDLVVDHAGRLGRLDSADLLGREPGELAHEIEAQAAQHALAHHAFLKVDQPFEAAVDQDEHEEHHAQREQIGGALHVDAAEELEGPTAEEVGKREDVSLKALIVATPPLKARPWIASLTIDFGRSSDQKYSGSEASTIARMTTCSRRLFRHT